MPHKLLLADDSVTIQRVIELTFADEDIRVIAVGDGRQAIERIQAERPDIVLADIGMPERDGYEVAAFVKSHPDLGHVPVLLLTGAFEPIDEGRAKAAGCDGVLVKPFEPQMVINRVKDLLAGRHPAGLWAATQLAKPQAAPAPPTPPRDTGPAAPPADSDARGSLDEYFDRLDAALGGSDSSPEALAPAAQGRTPAADARFPTAGDPLAGWDPDLGGEPVRPAAEQEPPAIDVALPSIPLSPGSAAPLPRRVEPSPAVPTPPPVSPPPPAPPVASAPQPVPAAAPAVPSAVSTWSRPAVEPTEAPGSQAAGEQAAGPAVPRAATLAEAFAALLSAERGQPIAPASVRAQDIPDDTIEEIVRRVIERMGSAAVRETVLDVAERLVREEIDRIKRG
jgi:CheY-like chemotaxis protein